MKHVYLLLDIELNEWFMLVDMFLELYLVG
jgi:hypothetical protein